MSKATFVLSVARICAVSLRLPRTLLWPTPPASELKLMEQLIGATLEGMNSLWQHAYSVVGWLPIEIQGDDHTLLRNQIRGVFMVR